MNYNKDYFKGRIKTAIICDTKDKWNEITNQFGLTWEKDDKWLMYKEDTAIIPETNTYCSIDFYKNGFYELVDFDYVDLAVGKLFKANTSAPTSASTAGRTQPSHVTVAPPKPKPIGDIIGVKVIKNFPNTDGFTVGTVITMYGAYKHKWKGVDFYKQSPEFFEWVHGYMPLFFGGNEVTIKKFNNVNCIVECNRKSDDYLHLLELRQALVSLSNFSFGGQRVEFVSGYNTSDKANLYKLKFGCTTGTFEELDAVIKRCERILSE